MRLRCPDFLPFHSNCSQYSIIVVSCHRDPIIEHNTSFQVQVPRIHRHKSLQDVDQLELSGQGWHEMRVQNVPHESEERRRACHGDKAGSLWQATGYGRWPLRTCHSTKVHRQTRAGVDNSPNQLATPAQSVRRCGRIVIYHGCRKLQSPIRAH